MGANDAQVDTSRAGMRSVFTVLSILDALAEHSPVGVGELARKLEIPKSTTHRGLQTLETAGWVSVDGLGRYSLTTHMLSLGLTASRESGLHEAVFPEMERLRDETGETVHLTVRDGMSVVLILRAEGTHVVRSMLPLGSRFPLYASSSAHAILASLPDSEIDQILVGLDTDPIYESRLSRDDVWQSIRAARLVGYTISTQSRHGIVGVGSLLSSQTTHQLAAITVSLPAHRFEEWDQSELGSLVRAAAQRASANWRTTF